MSFRIRFNAIYLFIINQLIKIPAAVADLIYLFGIKDIKATLGASSILIKLKL